MSKFPIYGLTLRRPWGYAITHLDKRVENRNWNCYVPIGSYLAIHNGLKWEEDGATFIRNLNRSGLIANPTKDNDPPGCIIAVAKFTGNITQSSSPWFIGPIGWEIDSVVPINPVPCRGQQGLWKLSEEVLEQVKEGYRVARHSIQEVSMRAEYCSRNGCGGIINGAAMPVPTREGCGNCGYPPCASGDGDDGLTTWMKVCPKCFHCLCCGRIIKRCYERKANEMDR